MFGPTLSVSYSDQLAVWGDPQLPFHCHSTNAPRSFRQLLASRNNLSNWQSHQITCCHSLLSAIRTPKSRVSTFCPTPAPLDLQCVSRAGEIVDRHVSSVCLFVSSCASWWQISVGHMSRPLWCDSCTSYPEITVSCGATRRGCLYRRISCVQSIPISEFSDNCRLPVHPCVLQRRVAPGGRCNAVP